MTPRSTTRRVRFQNWASLAARDSEPSAGPAFTTAITRRRERGTPYHLAHGLLDQAAYLTGLGGDRGRGPAAPPPSAATWRPAVA